MAVQDEVPKSRITLRYRTEINGTPADITLPLRLLILGDLSLGTSVDRKVDFEDRKMRNLDGKNTAAVIKDMKMSANFSCANKVDPETSETVDMSIPISGMKSFQPDEIAKSVPKLRALLMLRKLLLEVEANIGNSKEFKKALGELYTNEAALNKLREELKALDSLKLPAPAAAK